jgi:hypothetical protein
MPYRKMTGKGQIIQGQIPSRGVQAMNEGQSTFIHVEAGQGQTVDGCFDVNRFCADDRQLTAGAKID